MIKVLQSVHLLLVKVVHLMRCNHSVIVQINDFVPVLERSVSRLVFLAKHEPDKVFVAHFTIRCFKLARDLIKDAINSLAGQCVTFIAREVFFIDQEVMICIQFPEPAIEHIEVLVAEVLSDFVDVLLVAYVVQHVKQVRVFEVTEVNLAIVICVQSIEDSHHDCICVSLLEFWGLLEELKTWMAVQKVLENRLEIVCNDRLGTVFGDQFEKSALCILPMIVTVVPKSNQLLLVYFGFSSEFRQGAHLQLKPCEEHL